MGARRKDSDQEKERRTLGATEARGSPPFSIVREERKKKRETGESDMIRENSLQKGLLKVF